MRPARIWLPFLLVAGGLGCQPDPDVGGLHARRVVLSREVDGLRSLVERLERGEPALPPGDVAIAVDEALVRELVEQQLPFEAQADRFDLRLDRATATFRGSPTVTLQGQIRVRDQPELEGEIRLIGALAEISVDRTLGTLRAAVAVDHVDILRAAGFEAYLGGGTLDQLAQRLRHELAGRIPDVSIPVRLRETIELPAVDEGPVRLAGASLPLGLSVSQVFASSGRLWVCVHLEPGEFVRSPTAVEGTGQP